MEKKSFFVPLAGEVVGFVACSSYILISVEQLRTCPILLLEILCKTDII
jgi:hypothetical protein